MIKYIYGTENIRSEKTEKEVDKMKIAVTHQNGEVFQHFGHCKEFRIYEVSEGKIISVKNVSPMGSGHGALAGFLRLMGVNALICGGIGGGARDALAEAGISLYPGAEGSCDRCVEALLENRLAYDPDKTCNHHHEEGHSCGSHSCGEDKQGCAGNH